MEPGKCGALRDSRSSGLLSARSVGDLKRRSVSCLPFHHHHAGDHHAGEHDAYLEPGLAKVLLRPLSCPPWWGGGA